MKLLKKILPLAIISLLAGTQFAAAIQLPYQPALFESSLSAPQGTGDSTLTLAGATLSNGNPLTGYICFAIDSGQTNFEYECGTASTTPTTIINLTRGLDTQYGTSSVPALTFSHRRGADVKITNYPFDTLVQQLLTGSTTFGNGLLAYTTAFSISTSSLQIPYASWVDSDAQYWARIASTSANLFTIQSANTWPLVQTFTGNNINNGTPVFNGGATFNTTLPTSSVAPVNPSDLANKAYIDAVALQGSPTASNVATGTVKIATAAQAASATQKATSGAQLAISSAISSSTASTTSVVVVTNASDGKLDPSFLNGTGEQYTFNATTTFNAAVQGVFPNVFGTGADGSVTIAANSTTTLTRDMYYSNLTLNGVLVPNNYRVFVSNLATGTGMVYGSGNNGNPGVNSVPGAGGSTTPQFGYFFNGTTGGGGGSCSGGGQANNATTTFAGLGAAGGTFSTGGGGTGGTGLTTNGLATSSMSTIFLGIDWNLSTISKFSGGTGGGGGGSNDTPSCNGADTGGGGGQGGQLIEMFANNMGGSFSFVSNGGNGGRGNASGFGGGGGGGGGGAVISASTNKTSWTGTCTVNGGTGGIGGNSGGNPGSNGNIGICLNKTLSYFNY